MQNAPPNTSPNGEGQLKIVGGTSTAFDLGHLNHSDRARLTVISGVIRAELAAISHAATSGLIHGFALGEALGELKKLLGRGFWMREGEAWVTAHYALSMRSARDYLRLARHRETIESRIGSAAANLSIRGALRLIGPAKTARKRVAPSGLKIANWNAATPDQRAALVASLPFAEWRAATPKDWQAEIGNRSDRHIVSLEAQVGTLKRQLAASVPLRLVKTKKAA
jgi:hypothetical protein